MDSQRTKLSEQDLLAQVAWVDRLARRVVSDPELAADVAQDAWVRVLQRPSQDIKSVPRLRAWLRRVVSSAAVDSARSRARRDRREAAVALPESDTSTLDVVERFAARQRVVEAVLALDEPYRTTVLLRHLDELDTATIGEQMGVSPATVRKRLSRGLAMLRARLGSGAEGDGIASWLMALFIPAPLRSVAHNGGFVMAQTASAALVVKISVAALVVVALGFSGWWLVGPGDQSGAQAVSANDEPIAQRPMEIKPVTLAEFVAAPRERLAVSPEVVAEVSRETVDLSPAASPIEAKPQRKLLAVDENERPVPGVEVCVQSRPREFLLTDASGRVAVTVEPGGSLRLMLRHPSYLIERIEMDAPADSENAEPVGEEPQTVVVLHPGSVARVVVTDTRGAPVSGATVRLRDMDDNSVDGTIIGTMENRRLGDVYTSFGGTDIRETAAGYDGAAILKGLRPGTYQLRVWADHFVEVDRTRLEIVAGLNDLGLVTLADAVLVQGVVLGPGGPVEGATVELMPEVGGEYASARTDELGQFVMHTLSAYPAPSILKVRHDDHDTLCTSSLIINEAPLVLELQARSLAKLQLVHPILGKPIQGNVMLSREYVENSLLWNSHFLQRLSARAGEIDVTDMESCLQGVLVKVDGFPSTWVSREQLTAACDAPLTVYLVGEDLVLVVVTDLVTGDLIPAPGLKLLYREDREYGTRSSTVWHSSGSGSLFDAKLGGCPLDAQQLRVGRYGDSTQKMSIAAIAEGYEPGEVIVLVENGELIRSGDVRVALEPIGEG